MRIMRVSPPELERACPGPQASHRSTDLPPRRRCNAVHAPNTPAPTTATSTDAIPSLQHNAQGLNTPGLNTPRHKAKQQTKAAIRLMETSLDSDILDFLSHEPKSSFDRQMFGVHDSRAYPGVLSASRVPA